VQLETVCAHLDSFLGISEIPDHPAALNGLQVDNSGLVTRIATAVDASLATIEAAADAGADLLIVHHGLFWDGNQPVTGRRYRRLRRLFDADMALYSAHIPLDVHPEVGNNAVLARALGVEIDGTVGVYRGHPVGISGKLDIRREALVARLDELLGCRIKLIPGGPERTGRVGIVTGDAGGEIEAARQAGLDTFIIGEGAHHNYFDAVEGGINLILGGHYATETWGVRALGTHLEGRFGLPCTFIDHPTGL
jgi:dinuclear metal center YbgI/SA1388 family protein